MNIEEIAKEINTDSIIVVRKSKYLAKNVIREAVKSKNKNLIRVFEYKSKQKNDWLILVDYNKADPKIFISVHYNNSMGFNAVAVQPDGKALVHYSSHFLDRFNERFLKDESISKLDIFKRFILTNSLATYDFTPDDRKKVVARFKEGLGFGMIERTPNLYFIFLKTYISPDMIFEDQKNGYDTISNAFNEFWTESQIKGRMLKEKDVIKIIKPYSMGKNL